MTLPLIVALRTSEKRARKRILKIVRKDEKSWEDIRHIRAFVEEQGGITYAQEAMRSHADDALQHLAALPPTPARDALSELVAFTVARSH